MGNEASGTSLAEFVSGLLWWSSRTMSADGGCFLIWWSPGRLRLPRHGSDGHSPDFRSNSTSSQAARATSTMPPSDFSQPVINIVSALWHKRAAPEQVRTCSGRGKLRRPSSPFSSFRRRRGVCSAERTQRRSTLQTRSGCGSFKSVRLMRDTRCCGRHAKLDDRH